MQSFIVLISCGFFIAYFQLSWICRILRSITSFLNLKQKHHCSTRSVPFFWVKLRAIKNIVTVLKISNTANCFSQTHYNHITISHFSDQRFILLEEYEQFTNTESQENGNLWQRHFFYCSFGKHSRFGIARNPYHQLWSISSWRWALWTISSHWLHHSLNYLYCHQSNCLCFMLSL